MDLYVPKGGLQLEEFEKFLERELSEHGIDISRCYSYNIGYPHFLLLCKYLLDPRCKWKGISFETMDVEKPGGLYLLYETLHYNATVTSLDFAYSDITDFGCKHLLDLPLRITNIRIRDNKIGPYGGLLLMIRKGLGTEINDYCNDFDHEEVKDRYNCYIFLQRNLCSNCKASMLPADKSIDVRIYNFF